MAQGEKTTGNHGHFSIIGRLASPNWVGGRERLLAICVSFHVKYLFPFPHCVTDVFIIDL